ncbi:hypothetical protein T265_04682 [Opisthorchis viverrini]|uniref:Uncharacterized protein n=1 Tax=Opisthorchis viverrini TaxID=6198 RepID=A0A074ZN49_OPIVI|nr:hypothetical protein T265_04682 [Opisthorchis viverrini]KER28551.1 hypothetical protein T265_04682 [Opisthorchis viverrini]
MARRICRKTEGISTLPCLIFGNPRVTTSLIPMWSIAYDFVLWIYYLERGVVVTRSPCMSDVRGSNSGTAIGYALLMSSDKSETQVRCFLLV